MEKEAVETQTDFIFQQAVIMFIYAVKMGILHKAASTSFFHTRGCHFLLQTVKVSAYPV